MPSQQRGIGSGRRVVRASLVPALAVLLAACSAPRSTPPPGAGTPTFDRFGGLANVSFTRTGFFHLVHTARHDWLVDPDGHLFFSSGVNHVTLDSDTDRKTGKQPYREAALARYGTADAWTRATLARLRQWDVNTAGAWSDTARFTGHLPYTVILGLAGGSWHPGQVTDVFSQAWQDGVDAQVAANVAPHADDPWLVGYFTDNELRWTRDWTSLKRALFDDYLAMAPDAPGKQVLVKGLQKTYQTIGDLDAAWDVTVPSFKALYGLTALTPGPHADQSAVTADKRRFLGQVADRYFSYTSQAIHAADPNHLDLGCRFVSLLVPKEVLEAAGRYLDVVSVNNYVFISGLAGSAENLFGPLVSPGDFLSQFASLTGKPILVSETGFRAKDSGLPNDYPPVFPTYATQAGRADAWERYLRQGFAKPYVVGIHWFEYEDEPAGGRFDGEDDNWGLVDVKDDPYQTVVDRFRTVYGELYASVLGTSR